ncbi:MAG: DNA translocase FtsK [Defluviitaleaceae bacterium]|nr:DNA translocase FtsK [Defluviitaleaceae bacterium]
MPNKSKSSHSSKPKPRPVGRPRTSNPEPADRAINKEVKCLIMIAFGILLFLSVFVTDTIGFVGRLFANLFFGLFGFGAFLFPIILIAVAITILINRNIRLPIGLSITLYVLILSMLHIINSHDFEELGFFALLGEVYSEGGRTSGGLTGAFFGELLYAILGNVGSVVALTAAILIVTVLITGRSFIALVSQGASAVSSVASRARNHYARLPDDYSNYDNDYDHKPRKGKKPDLYEMENDFDYEDPDLPPVRLFQEEIDGTDVTQAMKRESGEGPLFSRRTIEKKPPELILFPDEEEPDNQFYADPPVVKGLVEEPLEDMAEESNEYHYAYPPKQEAQPPQKVVSFPAPQAPEPIIRGRPPQSAPVISYSSVPSYDDFQLPPLSLLNEPPVHKSMAESRTQILENSRILEETLSSFRIEAKVVEVSVGPTVTRYDLAPGPGVKVASIANLSNDLALSLAAQGIRIEAPIPGKSAVGIEIPNKESQPVYLREIIQEQHFINYPSKLAFAVGKDIAGEPVVTDIAKMPHLLIAGATGSGKSVCINTLITSLLYKARPDEVKLLMIDPKVVELSVYNGIPHLLIPVVTDPKKASGALSWAVSEMETRYNMFAETGCRDLKGFNKLKAKSDEAELPQIVIIIDELADLMMSCKGEVEESICRLAQKARAAGIHLIVATQRPSVDVITGLIKANIPSRLAFAVSSGTDSRTIIDMYGAEKLLGKGDMLFHPMGNNKPVRIQGGFISDHEVEGIVNFLKAQAPAEYTTEMIQQVTMPGKTNIEGEVDEFFHEAVDFLLTKGKASTSMLQRQFRIGYNRASRLMDELETRGIVGPEDGVKPRKVTITREEYQELYG